MAQVVTQVGGGIGDTSSSSGWYNYGAGQDWVSQYYFPDTVAHGGFTDATGSTFNTTVKQFNVTNITLRLGGTSAGNAAASTGYIELATANTGGGGYNDSTNTFTLSGTITSKSTGTIDWNVSANTMYYYGYYQTGGVAYTVFATGTAGASGLNGTTPDVWFNGSARNLGQRISGQITTQTIPDAPTSLSSSNIKPTSFTLNWQAGTDDGTQTTASWADSSTRITGYNIIYKRSVDSNWSLYTLDTGVLTPTAGVYSYSITGLKPGTSYDFKIGALNRTTTAINTTTDLTKATGVRSATLTVKTNGGVYSGGIWNPLGNATYRSATSATISSASINSGNPTVTCTVPSTLISTTGTIGAVTLANGKYTATITGMSSTSGLEVNQRITATKGTGDLAGSEVYVGSILSSTSITAYSTSAFKAGTVTNITASVGIRTGDSVTISGGAATWFNGTWSSITLVDNAAQFRYVSNSSATTATSSGSFYANRPVNIKVWNGSSWVTYF